MEGVDALELIAHRIVWSLVFLGIVLLLRPKGFSAAQAALSDRRILGLTFVSGGFLTVNWLTYVWAVNNGYVIESSLGYFLVPLVNVAMGSLLLGERLRPAQWIAVGFAACGVMFLLVGVGRLPWIALVLAGSWGMYGIMRKRSTLGAIDGLTVETVLYFPFALAYLIWRHSIGLGVLGHSSLRLHLLVLSAGWVTALPLILFGYGVRQIRLSTIGLMQYLAPTIQFLLGLLLYHEAFDAPHLKACLVIWLGLALYTADSFWARRRVLRGALMPN